MNRLDEAYGELSKGPAPKGFHELAEDLNIKVNQYAAFIMGLVQSYLSGRVLKVDAVRINDELNQRIEECAAKLNELRLYKQHHDALARLLLDELRQNTTSTGSRS